MATDGDASQRAKFSGGRIAELHRARTSRRNLILDAVVEVVAERGVAGASVGLVCAGAGVSSRTFHDLFAGLEDCLVAVMDRTLERVGVLVSRAFAGEGSWRDGMRAALAAVLEFFDSEPRLAQVCLVQTLAGGLLVLEQRERVVGAFRALVVARIEGEVSSASPLAAEGALASVMGIVHARLIARERAPLIELLGPLMGVIVGPFSDEQTVVEETRRGEELARAMLAERACDSPASESASGGVSVPVALRNPGAYRARLCLLYVASYPGANNSEVAAGIGVSHRGQVSTLLARLAGLGPIPLT
jgi:AcrR family transcriptional regulator